MQTLQPQQQQGDPIIKRCACGAEYTREGWGSLGYVGVQDDGEDLAELRLCGACDSTIGVYIGPSEGHS